MPQSPRRKKSRPSLPKHIRDELRMTCAIRALDYFKKSGPKTLAHQAREVYDFFHCKEPSRPSQILLLSKGMGVYSSLYEIHQLPALRDNDSEITTKRLRLKEELSLDLASLYFSELDIKSKDLEKNWSPSDHRAHNFEHGYKRFKRIQEGVKFCKNEVEC